MEKHCLMASFFLLIFVCSPANASRPDNEDDDNDFHETLLATDDENTIELLGGC